MSKIYVHCDGGCRNNQSKENIGGWGALLQYGEKEKELFGAAKNTTNNIMELTSVIEALSALKRHDIPVVVTMDSEYVVKGVNDWSQGWIKRNWKTSDKKDVANKALWKDLLGLISKFNDIKFIHCKGHADNEGNNRADQLANKAMDQ